MDVYFNDALAALANAGLKLEHTKLPELPWVEVLDVIIEAEAEVAFEDLLRSGRVRQLSDPRHQQPTAQYQYHRAGRPSDYVKAMAVRAAMQDAMEWFFTRYDLIVAGTVAAVAPPVDRTCRTPSSTIRPSWQPPRPPGRLGRPWASSGASGSRSA